MLCPSDNLAVGIIQAAYRLGISVPEQLMVMGYDNNHLAAESRVPVSSVRQPATGWALGPGSWSMRSTRAPSTPTARSPWTPV